MSALFMRWGTSFFRLFLIASFGGGLILAMGWAQLAFLLGSGIKAWHLGGLPFILGDVVKSIMALWLVYGILKGSYQR
jgi:biotin transporter BioY